MAFFDKIGRLIRLGGIIGLSLGSFLVSACTDGSSPGANDNHDQHEGGVEDAGVDASADASLDAGTDASEVEAGTHYDAEPPDADLWDVICE